MWDRIYVGEKLRDLERERLARQVCLASLKRGDRAIRAAQAAGCPRGLRAGFASRLARLALALHRDAATEAGLRAGAEGRS